MYRSAFKGLRKIERSAARPSELANMIPSRDLREELDSEFSFGELLKIARSRGLKENLETKQGVVDWLMRSGLTWREYALKHNAYFALKLRICRFFGVRRGWRVLDVGCGSGGTSIAAASLVGDNGRVLAVDPLEECIKQSIDLVQKTRFEDIVEVKRAKVLDLDFDKDYFDIALLLYTPQFLGYIQDFREVLFRIREWTKSLGVADHLPFPENHAEGVYLLLNWPSCDVARTSLGKRTDRLYHMTEVERALEGADLKIVKQKIFRVSKKNTYPPWAMNENLLRLKKQTKAMIDHTSREVYESRLLTIRSLTEKGIFPKPTSIFAVLARK